MKRDYFIYKGKTYKSGTDIKIVWICKFTASVMYVKATFIEHDLSNDQYVLEIFGNKEFYSEKHFYNAICHITDEKINQIYNHPKKYTFSNELNIDGMFIAWLWYIFIMLVGVIFYARIGIWILASVIFFNYRKNKLKGAGYK